MSSPVGIHRVFTRTIFFVYILLLVVQDLPLQQTIGTIARSPYVVLSPIVFVLILITSGKLFSFKVVNIYVLYFLYSILLSSALLIYFLGFQQIENRIYGENLILKFFKSSTYNLIIIITIYNFVYIFKKSSNQFILSVVQALILLQLVIGFVQIISPGVLTFLKTPELNSLDRLSLLNSEPSSAFPQFFVSFLCFAAYKIYNKDKFGTIDFIIVIATISLLIMIQSRGGLVVSVACILAIVFFTKGKLKTKLAAIVVASIVSIPIIYVIINVVVPGLILDIEEFNSISTRSITILTAVISLFKYPFGQGYSTYLITFPPLLSETTNLVVNTWNFPLLTSEIDEMILTGRSLTVKSGFLNETLYSGWPVVIFYLFLFKEAYRKMRVLKYSTPLFMMFRIIFLFLIVNNLFVSSWETSYIYFIPFALLEKMHLEILEMEALRS